jgi:hypothetical protein
LFSNVGFIGSVEVTGALERGPKGVDVVAQQPVLGYPRPLGTRQVEQGGNNSGANAAASTCVSSRRTGIPRRAVLGGLSPPHRSAALQLPQGAFPVFDVIGLGDFSIPNGMDVDRHDAKASPSRR